MAIQIRSAQKVTSKKENKMTYGEAIMNAKDKMKLVKARLR